MPRYFDPASWLRAIAPATVGVEWSRPERPIQCALVGLGNRGQALARILSRLDGVKITWLVDASAERIRQLQQQVHLKDAKTGVRFSRTLAAPEVDAVFVALPDHLHRAVAQRAFGAGKHVFLEKPIATTLADGKAILAAWKASGRALQIGYVLRSAPFYHAIRNVIRQGWLGPVRMINLGEQLSVVHGASFMRRWHADARLSGGLIVHKSCHDLDLVCWLLDSRPRYVSSFGGSDTFRRPAPAPFCSECELRSSCPYVDNALYENRTKAERANPTAFGLDRCVFSLDPKIIDNQVVSFELENGVRGTYYLAMQGPARSERRITVIGDEGRLDGIFQDNCFKISYADSHRESSVWSAKGHKLGGHDGGDVSSVVRFLNACVGRTPSPITTASDALAGLVFAISAERSRVRRAMLTLHQEDFELADSR